jgi:hypothetical protein
MSSKAWPPPMKLAGSATRGPTTASAMSELRMAHVGMPRRRRCRALRGRSVPGPVGVGASTTTSVVVSTSVLTATPRRA